MLAVIHRSAAVLAICATVILGNAALAAGTDSQAVTKANAEFYSALNVLFTGAATPMANVWSHAADVTYMGPTGDFLVGWKQVSAEWQAEAAQKLGGTVEPKDTRITVGHDLAVVNTVEKGNNVVNGKPQSVSIRATNIFRKEAGAWKMIGHHTDLLPYLQK
jgi:ketosteroid isomerase-like protein